MCGGDLRLVWVDGEHGRGSGREAKGQATVAAAELENTETVNRSELLERAGLGTFGIDVRPHCGSMTADELPLLQQPIPDTPDVDDVAVVCPHAELPSEAGRM